MRIKWFSLVRITGLLLVLLYHFFKNSFPGGFVGVDIFFTFSGFLITALLIDEFSKTKKIDFVSFCRRRFYRIFPPLVLMVLVTIPFVFLVKSDFRASIGSQIMTALGFTSNFYEILTGGNYESQFIPHLFVHTWSLSIEVHFYVLWGLTVWLLSKRSKDQKQLRGTLFLISMGVFGVSFLTMFVRAFFVDNFSTIYFSTLSHIFPFFLGAMVATISGIREITGRFKKNIKNLTLKHNLIMMGSAFAALMILTFALDFDNRLTYLFGFVLSSIFASVMIYNARILHEHTPDISEPFVITYLADISYGMYLFHWPFYIIFSRLSPNWIAVILTVVLSAVFSTLSFYVIEPFILGRKPKFLDYEFDLLPYKKWLFSIGGVLTLITVVTMLTAPSIGSFETELLQNSLQQARTNTNRTHTLAAGDAGALSDVTVIGDSVALRSSAAFNKLLPEVQLDAAVSRNFSKSFDIFENRIQNKALSKIVVLAVGVNSLDNYKTDLSQFIKSLPKGHRLIIVTPYNAKNMSQVTTVRDYELSLMKKYNYITVADWYK
ncbi:acetyltransferase, partial [Streptococcus agalactiae]